MLELRDLELNYGQKVIFGGVSARVEARDRVGLVGSNGSGKSTLLRVLAQEEELNGGKVITAKDARIGYLPQDGLTATGANLMVEVEQAFPEILALRGELAARQDALGALDHDSEAYRSALHAAGELEHELEALDAHKLTARIEKILFGLGFNADDLQRPCAEFSGGWQMRIALAKLLLASPALLLLDEPTNHLDLPSQRWLEQYLGTYPGAILLVSHDRAFLDQLTNRTFALSRGRLEVYAGNYSYFESQSAQRKEHRVKAAAKQQREIAQTERFIERFRAKATKARQVQSRIKALDKVERIETEEDEATVSFRFPPPPRSGQRVLRLEGLEKRYGDLTVLRDVSLAVERGERIALVGPNGAGKTTLTKILAGAEGFQAGEREEGLNVHLAYFAQHQADALPPEDSVLDAARATATQELMTRVRDVLGVFLFRGDDVFKPVKVLSGGEKNRLALARILLRPVNCLILDEPTNHLDMASKAVLQDALHHFSGTLLIVSHDRSFLDPLVTKVLEVTPGRLRWFAGNVSEYLAKVEAEQSAATALPTRRTGSGSSGVVAPVKSAKERRRLEAERRATLAPLRKAAERTEAEVEAASTEVETWESAMRDPAWFQRGAATAEDMKTYEAAQRRLAVAEEAWTEAQSALEAAEEA